MQQNRLDITKVSYYDYSVLYPVLTEESRTRSAEWLKGRAKPMFVAGVETPRDLNGLTYGQLCDIQEHGKDIDGVMHAVAVVLPSVPTERLMNERAEVVVGFVAWIGREVERINRLFAKIAPRYTPEQIAAGVNGLQFGTFGVLDWYAKRQGIADQNEVRAVPWVRIYQCMKNDADVANYNLRLNAIITNKIKQR